MENRKRVLPQWLTDLHKNGVTKKRQATKTRENTDGKTETTHEDASVSSAAVSAQKVCLELSNSEDENDEESCVIDVEKERKEDTGNVQCVDKVVSDNSNPPSPSIVQSVPTSCLVDCMDDAENDPPSSQVMQRPLSPPSGVGASNNSIGTGLVRPICTYGDKCYRNNPQHKIDFSHPGDDDFTSVDNRPECKYGLSCYRKNSLHRQHYKHTKKVLKPRKAKQSGNVNVNNDSSDEDDYDLQDPFINDDSSDDYKPESSDDTDLSDTSDALGINKSND